MLRTRGPAGLLGAAAKRQDENIEDFQGPKTPALLSKASEITLPTRIFHKSSSASFGARSRSLDDAASDAEAGSMARGSPKKADIPAYRRRKPVFVMFLILALAGLLGMALVLTHDQEKRAESGQDRNGWAAAQTPAFKDKYIGEEYFRETLVEFTVPGLYIPIKYALDLTFPVQHQEQLLYNKSDDASFSAFHSEENIFEERFSAHADARLQDNDAQEQQLEVKKPEWHEEEPHHRGLKSTTIRSRKNHLQKSAADRAAVGDPHNTLLAALASTSTPDTYIEWPHPHGINLLVAITSACCSQISLERRLAIRQTWGALTKQRYPQGVTIQFFISQPGNETVLQEWLPALEAETHAYNDTVVLRGRDTYLNLPNKTFRMFRYALAHPREFTHVLKADDDTWVRMHKIIEILQEQEPIRPLGGVQTEATGGLRGHEARAGLRKLKEMLAAAALQRKKELTTMSKDRQKPIVSDGMSLYDATSVVMRVSQQNIDTGETFANPKDSVDDIDGSTLTLEALAQRAGWYIEQNTSNNNSSGSMRNSQRRGLLLVKKGEEDAQGGAPRLRNVYLGCVEVRGGFHPVRNNDSKWYVSEADLPDSAIPKGVQYHAGWGYLLSRDLMQHLVMKVNKYEAEGEAAPLWFRLLHWEDVLVGLLLSDVVATPESHPAFRPAWRSCAPGTAVRHLDVDSPRLLAALVEQDASGLADEKPVQCSSGQFLPGDYAGWYDWKLKLEKEKESRKGRRSG